MATIDAATRKAVQGLGLSSGAIRVTPQGECRLYLPTLPDREVGFVRENYPDWPEDEFNARRQEVEVLGRENWAGAVLNALRAAGLAAVPTRETRLSTREWLAALDEREVNILPGSGGG